jgi:hypothetical protein
MTFMTPAYGFDLKPQRFDTHVTKAFEAAPTRWTYDKLIAQLRNGQCDHMLLKRLDGLEALSDATNEKAARNIIDFWFEPLVLKSMSVPQLAAYFQAVEKTIRLTEASALDSEGPLWIDSVHHSCVFSVLLRIAALVGQHRGFRRLVLLHQGQRPEPRLGMLTTLLRQIPQVEPVCLPLNGRWFQALSQMTTPKTAIFYLSDMPAEAFERESGQRDRRLSQLQLYAENALSVRLNTLSGSPVFAARLRATHLVVEYPRPDRVSIRPFDAHKPTVCPLEDWIFWPLVGARPSVG